MELRHYDHDEVVRILVDALACVTEAEISDALAPIAFEKAVQMLSAKTIDAPAPAGLLLGQRSLRGG